uniref:Protein ABHD1-like n=1 Tax=Dermatophagoides pteronyssinus TaxID=6956 RepID=A0A6P6YDP1_DERPT|nr:protein ABHD1-like [Dermatophagoides pteronyssinus]
MDMLNVIVPIFGGYGHYHDMITLIFQWANDVTDFIIDFYLNAPRTFFAILLFMIYVFHYIANIVKKPILVTSEGRFRWFLLANCPVISEKYWPTIWCYETHLLTALANYIRGFCADLHYHRELLQTPDGGQISLDWYDPNCERSSPCSQPGYSFGKVGDRPKPIALFMPGLTGSSQSEYIKTLVPIAFQIGYRPVVINYRGLGNTPLLTPRLYCAANDDDIHTAINHIRHHNPDCKLIATGISLGGILLCRYLISTGFESQINAAFLISVCWDLMIGCENMERSLNYPLNHHLTRLLVNLVDANHALFKNVPGIDLDRVRQCQNVREFDEAFTIKIFNFESVSHYYAESSHLGKMSCIRTPTLCINASDDMFAPTENLPWDVEQSRHVALLVTSRGGHIGFMEGIFPFLKSKFYTERLMEQYYKALYRLSDCHQIV